MCERLEKPRHFTTYSNDRSRSRGRGQWLCLVGAPTYSHVLLLLRTASEKVPKNFLHITSPYDSHCLYCILPIDINLTGKMIRHAARVKGKQNSRRR
jgi:hypothetical protein